MVEVQKEQKVVHTGPYGFIHWYIFDTDCIALALQSWIAVLVALAIFGMTFGHRLLSEEKFLIKELSNVFSHQMTHTKRIIPFII